MWCISKGAFFQSKGTLSGWKEEKVIRSVIGKKWNKEQRGKTVSTGTGTLLHISIEAHQVRSSITGLKWVRWQKNDIRKQRDRHISFYSRKKLKGLNILFIASSHITHSHSLSVSENKTTPLALSLYTHSLKTITRSLTLRSLSLIQFKHAKLYIALLSNSLKINEWLLGISIIKEWSLEVRILGRRILLKKFSRKRTQSEERSFLSEQRHSLVWKEEKVVRSGHWEKVE